MNEFHDSALVLLGHGSTLNAESSVPTLRHAAELRRRGIFGQVVTGFWKEHPFFCGVLRSVFTPRVFIVPLFISEGYFTEEVIPRELGLAGLGQLEFPRVQHRGERTFHYCGPVGTHPSMTAVILSRARGIVEGSPNPPAPAETSLFIAGHGTGNNENSRRAIEDQVLLIRKMGVYHDVHPVFMEEDPRIQEVHHLAETPNAVVVPFFISDGLHSFEDIPVMLGAPPDAVQERLRRGEPTWINPTVIQDRRIWYTRSIGDEPHIPDVVVERVRESALLAAVETPGEVPGMRLVA
jgi:sirohydrochlorin cobaltochelatase